MGGFGRDQLLMSWRSLHRGRVRQRCQCSLLASLLAVSATEETEAEKTENYHGHSQTSAARLRHVIF